MKGKLQFSMTERDARFQSTERERERGVDLNKITDYSVLHIFSVACVEQIIKEKTREP